MKRISRHFETLRQAEQYQSKLYESYDSVKLVDFPRFSEAGQYVWEVTYQ